MSDLKAWRDAQNINQDEAAKALGMSVSHLSMLETGKRKPSLSMALEIEKKTNGTVTPDSFYETSPPP